MNFKLWLEDATLSSPITPTDPWIRMKVLNSLKTKFGYDDSQLIGSSYTGEVFNGLGFNPEQLRQKGILRRAQGGLYSLNPDIVATGGKQKMFQTPPPRQITSRQI